MGRVSIFTVTHKKFTPPADPIYIPIHAGRELSEELGYLGDNTGKHISSLNPYYSELTALYWIWKNYEEAEVIGLCHYRRYFLNENVAIMSAREYEEILEKSDVITSLSVKGRYNYYNVYKKSHNIRDLEAVGRAIQIVAPQYYGTFLEVICGDEYYVGNLFVTTKKYFKSYAKWLFAIFDEAKKEIDVTGYDDYHKRVYGFLSEQLLRVWIKYNKLRVHETDIGIVSEKAETIETKEKIYSFVKEKNFIGAGKYLSELSAKRPDIALKDSDMSGELFDMANVLNLCIFEEKNDVKSFCTLSDDIYILIKHYLEIESIVNNIFKEEIDNVDIEKYQYLKQNQISYMTVIYFIEKIQDAVFRQQVYNKIAIINEQVGWLNAVLPYYDCALSINDKDPSTLKNLSNFLEGIGEYELAAQYRFQAD